ncbi:MAG TPA: hypothetical protein VEL28_05710 [Candidatus Binatia bacterium]|nr:hypothetical protein [Candidatus Binatia bacterium]
MLDVSDDLRAAIESLGPLERRARALPDTPFDHFEEVMRKLCIRWLLVPQRGGSRNRFRVALEVGTNPLYVICQLRTVSEIRDAGFEHWAENGYVGNVRANIVGDTTFVEIIPPPLMYRGEQLFVVAPGGVRQIERSEADATTGFDFADLSADVWISPLPPDGEAYRHSSATLRFATPRCRECDGWSSDPDNCPYCRGCYLPTVEEAAGVLPFVEKSDHLIRHREMTWSETVPGGVIPSGLTPVHRLRIEFTPRVTGDHTAIAKTFDCSCFSDRLECTALFEPVVFDADPADYVLSYGGAPAEVLRIVRLYRDPSFESPNARLAGMRLERVSKIGTTYYTMEFSEKAGGCGRTRASGSIHGQGADARLVFEHFNTTTSRDCGVSEHRSWRRDAMPRAE